MQTAAASVARQCLSRVGRCAPAALVAAAAPSLRRAPLGSGVYAAGFPRVALLRCRGFATSAGSGDPAEGAHPPLVASATTNIGRLAGAITARVRQTDAAELTAVGAQAIYSAIKATILANNYLLEEFPGRQLALVPSKVETKSPEGTAVMSTRMALRLSAKVPFGDQVNIYSSKAVNTGLMAGLMAQTLENQPVVVVGAMGAEAVNNVLKACMIQQSRLADASSQLVLVPKRDEFEEHGTKRIRVLFACTTVKF